VALSLVVPVIGPPAAGKTTLIAQFGREPGRAIFRLREHVPKDVLAATATSAVCLGWIDEFTVADALHRYFEVIVNDPTVHTVLLDNFPGSASQVDQLLATLWAVTPPCHIEVVEVVTDTKVLKARARIRKVCHRCERDPISDPRVPAVASAHDPWQCAACGDLLHPRRGDSPSLFKARMQRYQRAADGIRDGFTSAGVTVSQLDTSDQLDGAVKLLSPLLVSRSTPL
jgi:adenylate kinase